MRNFRPLLVLAAAALCLSSCTRIKGNVSPVPSVRQLYVKQFSGSNLVVTDSVKIASDGSFSYSPSIGKGKPEFFYLYYGNAKLASLLLSRGDKVTVQCDTVGLWTVEGSDDCELLRQNEIELARMNALEAITRSEFIKYYQKMTRFVFANSHSLAVIPVLLQKIKDIEVFGQTTDALIFEAMADSLSSVYPESSYVKLLEAEASSRRSRLTLQTILDNAQSQDFIDLSLPDVSGNEIKLSSLSGKPTLLVFWNAQEIKNKLFNQDVLKPLYDEYQAAGLKIYQVNVGSDKSSWATIVKQQNMPWTNVCDASSISALTYNLDKLPTCFVISGGKLEKIEGKSLRTEVSRYIGKL